MNYRGCTEQEKDWIYFVVYQAHRTDLKFCLHLLQNLHFSWFRHFSSKHSHTQNMFAFRSCSFWFDEIVWICFERKFVFWYLLLHPKGSNTRNISAFLFKNSILVACYIHRPCLYNSNWWFVLFSLMLSIIWPCNNIRMLLYIYFIFVYFIFVFQIVLYFLHSTLVLPLMRPNKMLTLQNGVRTAP